MNTATWTFTITTETGETTKWDWKQFTALPAEDITTDIHCVTQWSKLGTKWHGVSLDMPLDGIGSPRPTFHLISVPANAPGKGR